MSRRFTDIRAIGAAGLIVLTVLAGCSGRNAPTNPDNEQWFCQSNETGEGWECVQDNNLAMVPVPTRLPPEPTPEPLPGTDPNDVDLNDPLDFDALNAPLERNPSANPGEAAAVNPDLSEENTPEDSAPVEATGAAPVTNTSADQAPPPPPVEQSTQSQANDQTAATTADPRIPRHVALAYTPPQPTQITELPSNFFAVQMLAMRTPAEIEAYIDDNRLVGMSGARVEKDGELFYVLIVGIYDTYAKADEAAKSLPPPLDDVDVWIRPLGSLQQAMLRADELTGSTRY